MTCKLLFCLILCVLSTTQITCAESNAKGLIPGPIEIAQWQIRILYNMVKRIVDRQLEIIKNIRETVQTIADKAIESATNLIDTVLDGTVRRMRSIIQNAIDNGINATECLVLHLDKLNILRRNLIVSEIQCATSQIGEFYDILDGVAKNITDNIFTVIELPKRLQKCIITITPISCVTNVIEDITALQKNIPKQIMGAMLEVTEYFNGFDQRVHKCQFMQLRKAIDGTRKLIDSLYVCIREKEMIQTTQTDVDVTTEITQIN